MASITATYQSRTRVRWSKGGTVEYTILKFKTGPGKYVHQAFTLSHPFGLANLRMAVKILGGDPDRLAVRLDHESWEHLLNQALAGRKGTLCYLNHDGDVEKDGKLYPTWRLA